MAPLFHDSIQNNIQYREGLQIGDLIASSTKYVKRSYFCGLCYREYRLDENISIEPGTPNSTKIGFNSKPK